jgi:TPR repeat protein
MRLQFFLYLFGCLAFSASDAFPQNVSPSALRAEARALTSAQVAAFARQVGQGDSEAQLMMGLTMQLYAERIRFDAQGRDDSYKLSAYWFRKAAEKGSVPALYFVALSDLQFMTCEDEEAFQSLGKAISLGYRPAMTALGQLYMDAPCDKTNYSKGLQLLRRAAEEGDPEAFYFVGCAFEQGRGVKADQIEATKWFLEGAQKGDPSSQNSVGTRLFEGLGTQKNLRESVEWWRKSAEQGNYEAACNLAVNYMRGQGVPRDYITSLMWGLIADVNATGIGCLSEIDSRSLLRMTPAQGAEAMDRANAWLKEHHYPLSEPFPR